MKCSKCKKLIHSMLDGNLNKVDQRQVCAHLETCDSCREYHEDIARICAELREQDKEPPQEFAAGWKQAVADAAAPRRTRKRRIRTGIVVPIAACCAGTVFVVSTLLVNPQAFGLEGKNVTGEWFGAVLTGQEPEPAPEVSQGSGQKVSFVATSEKKPNVLDYENSDYSETTTRSTRVPQLSAAGTIEPHRNELMDVVSEGLDQHGTALPEEIPVLALTVSDEERGHLIERAEALGAELISEDESETVLEGTPEQLEDLTEGYHMDVPADAERVRLLLQQ